MKLKRVFGVGIAIGLMAPIGVLTSVPAGAATIVTCAKPSGVVTFSPGLGTTKKIQTTSFSLPVKNCKGGGVTSGTSKGSTKGTKPQNCASFASDPSASTTQVTITWNTKKTSTAKLATKVSGAPDGSLIATVSGKISKGLFLGKTIKTKVKVTLQKGAICTDQNPLKKATLTGLSALTIG